MYWRLLTLSYILYSTLCLLIFFLILQNHTSWYLRKFLFHIYSYTTVIVFHSLCWSAIINCFIIHVSPSKDFFLTLHFVVPLLFKYISIKFLLLLLYLYKYFSHFYITLNTVLISHCLYIYIQYYLFAMYFHFYAIVYIFATSNCWTISLELFISAYL